MVSTGPSISNRSCWSFLACFWCSFGAVLVQLDPDIGTVTDVTGRSAGWNANDRLLCGQRLGSIHWGDFATANHQHFWVRWFVMFDRWFDMFWLMTINDDQWWSMYTTILALPLHFRAKRQQELWHQTSNLLKGLTKDSKIFQRQLFQFCQLCLSVTYTPATRGWPAQWD